MGGKDFLRARLVIYMNPCYRCDIGMNAPIKTSAFLLFMLIHESWLTDALQSEGQIVFVLVRFGNAGLIVESAFPTTP
jgi:hypothetical protein